MARFSPPDSLPNPTPVIDDEESEFSINSIRSTPCPGRGLFPQGPSLAEDSSDIFASGTIIPDSVGMSIDQEHQLAHVEEQDDHLKPAQKQDNHPKQAQKQRPNRHLNSLIMLREALTNSTALVNSLRTRNEFFRAENSAKDAQLKAVKEARDGAKAVDRSNNEERELLERLVVGIVAIVVVMALEYAYWCWCHGPEMQYVLRRRREILGLSS